MRKNANSCGKRIIGIAVISACIIIGTPHFVGAEQNTSAHAPTGQCALTGSGAESMTSNENHTPTIGSVKALTLFIDFPDVRDTAGAQVRNDEFFPQTQNWFSTSSYGQMTYDNTSILKYFTMPHNFKSYGIARGASQSVHDRIIKDLISVADPEVDFAGYDLYNVLATPDAGAEQATVLSATWHLIAPFETNDGQAFQNTSFIYNHQDVNGDTTNRYRVLVHENGHALGLPDLYSYESLPDQVGHWDIMNADWGSNNDLLGWHKWKLGWLENAQVACIADSGISEHAVHPISQPGGMKLAIVRTSDTRAMTIEVRVISGNDEGQCSQGVLISWVNTQTPSGQLPIVVHNANPGSILSCDKPSMAWKDNQRLIDAPLKAGQAFHDPQTGTAVEVTKENADGSYQVKIARLSAEISQKPQKAQRVH